MEVIILVDKNSYNAINKLAKFSVILEIGEELFIDDVVIKNSLTLVSNKK